MARILLVSMLLISACGNDSSGDPPSFTFTPFTYVSQVYFQGGYSPSHNGLDIGANADASFRAVCEGVFRKRKYQNEWTGRWQVNAEIEYSSGFEVIYGFEPFGSPGDESAADDQMTKLIPDESAVGAGDNLGELHFVSSGCHVHFGVYPSADPLQYFVGPAASEMHSFVGW